MNDFYNTQLFLDPYAVEGEERAKRFAKNYNAQQRLGIPGVLEGWAIIREAERNLPPEHLKQFFKDIQLKQGSAEHKLQRLAGDRNHRWRAAFDVHAGDIAIMYVTATTADQFEEMIAEGRSFMKVIEQCDDYTGPIRHQSIN
jgi:hypothetical protein